MEPRPLAALLVLGALTALAIIARPTVLELQLQAIALPLPPAPATAALGPLSRHAFVLQAAASERWQHIFDKLKRELGAERVFALIDDEHAPFRLYSGEPAQRATQPRTAASPHVLLFNASEGWAAAPKSYAALSQSDWTIQHFQHPALALLTRHLASGASGQGSNASGSDGGQPFEYIFFLEPDIRCSGSWADCLAPAASLQDDLLCSSLQTHAQNPGWEHWGRRYGEAAELAEDQLSFCFSPLRRLSWRGMRVLARDLPRATGFLEVFYPSWLRHRGLKLGTIPAECIGDIGYVWGPAAADAPQKHAFLAAMERGGDGKLYHPVKL